jgi:hypothetical protein
VPLTVPPIHRFSKSQVRAWFPHKRFTLHLDVDDMKRLALLADQEFQATGVKVGVAGILRRLVKGYRKTATRKDKNP